MATLSEAEYNHGLGLYANYLGVSIGIKEYITELNGFYRDIFTTGDLSALAKAADRETRLLGSFVDLIAVLVDYLNNYNCEPPLLTMPMNANILKDDRLLRQQRWAQIMSAVEQVDGLLDGACEGQTIEGMCTPEVFAAVLHLVNLVNHDIESTYDAPAPVSDVEKNIYSNNNYFDSTAGGSGMHMGAVGMDTTDDNYIHNILDEFKGFEQSLQASEAQKAKASLIQRLNQMKESVKAGREKNLEAFAALKISGEHLNAAEMVANDIEAELKTFFG